MGIARYENGVFRLVVSLRHDADAARIDEWRLAFQRASQMLFDATLGQHRFGQILVANDSMGAAEADCWLMEAAGRSVSSHGFAQPGEHCTLMADERFKPFIILHEFSHYAYDVFDEYAGDGGAAECIGGTTENACILESSWTDGDRFGAGGDGGPLVEGRVKHYCVASNHDPDGDTRQDQRRNQSCWESMVGRFPDLVMPSSPPSTSSAGNVPNIGWVILAPERRYMLVVDRSGSMTGAKLREAQAGCHWWIDNAALGDLLGSVSFSSSASVDRSLQPLAADADRQPHRDAVDAWVAGGNTAIGGALRTALDEIVGLGPRAATQVALLLTDGLQTGGEAVENVVPDLIEAGVRLYAVAVGDTIDEPLLNSAATQTGGRFVRIDPALSEADQAFAVRTALEELSIESRDNGGIVTSSPERAEPGGAVQRTATIDRGCKRATFLVSRRAPKDLLSLRLVDPSGRAYSLATAAANVRVIAGDEPYAAIQIGNPRAGTWRIVIRASRTNARAARFHLLVGCETPDIGTAFFPSAATYAAGDAVRLFLRVFSPAPITGIGITATLRGPRLRAQAVTFHDDGSASDAVADDGVYTATFKAPRVPGTYMVRALVTGAEGVARFAETDDPGDRTTARRNRVASFTRTLETTFVVLKS